MRLQIASDLHLEFHKNRDFIESNPLQASGEILILAGDIILLRNIDRYNEFFDWIADNYEHTYWVPGNHEYYHLDVGKHPSSFSTSIRSNITLLNNYSIELNDVHLHFTSLWSNISESKASNIQRGLTDFHVINWNGEPLTVDQYNQMHAKSVKFLKVALKSEKPNKDIRNIVVTHHVPSFQNYPTKYLSSLLNEAFATNMDEFIETSGADYWIYGHHHATTNDFTIGKTKLVTNQLGYVHHGEHTAFDFGRILDL